MAPPFFHAQTLNIVMRIVHYDTFNYHKMIFFCHIAHPYMVDDLNDQKNQLTVQISVVMINYTTINLNERYLLYAKFFFNNFSFWEDLI